MYTGATIAQALSQNTSLLTLSLKANLIHDATGSALVIGEYLTDAKVR